MGEGINKIKGRSENLGSSDGVEIGVSSNIWEQLEKQKTQQGTRDNPNPNQILCLGPLSS